MKYTNDDIIIKEGEPLQLMLIIVEGVVSIEKGNCSSNSQRGAGGLCGEELLFWPALISFPDKLLATESARAIGDVEALVLMASDMESVGIKFATLFQECGNPKRQLYTQLQTLGAAIFTEKELGEGNILCVDIYWLGTFDKHWLFLKFLLTFHIHLSSFVWRTEIDIGLEKPVTLKQVKYATRNFSKRNEIGQGGFGAVYKVTNIHFIVLIVDF